MRVEQKYNVGNSIGRIFFVAVFMTFQVWLMYAIITHYDDGSGILDKTIQLIALLIVLRVYGQHKNAANKMPWIILILIFPLLGILLWSLTSGSLLLVRKKKHFLKYDAALPGILPQNQNAARLLRRTADCSRNPAMWRSMEGFRSIRARQPGIFRRRSREDCPRSRI